MNIKTQYILRGIIMKMHILYVRAKNIGNILSKNWELELYSDSLGVQVWLVSFQLYYYYYYLIFISNLYSIAVGVFLNNATLIFTISTLLFLNITHNPSTFSEGGQDVTLLLSQCSLILRSNDCQWFAAFLPDF